MINIFEYSRYKPFLKALEKERASLQRGFRSRLAETLNCQNAYISQVLNSHANFSLEQGLKIASLLNLGESETKYFLHLIEYARAGTKELEDYFQKELMDLRNKNLNIKEKLSGVGSLNLAQQTQYYSSWIYSSIHMLITIAEFRTPDKIAEALRVDLEQVNEVLLFLISSGLAIEAKGRILPGSTQIHLAKDTPLIRQHHSNWRIAAINSLSGKSETDIHYSTVSTLSHEDAEYLKQKFVQMIEQYVKTIGPSKEETLYNFNLDFYTLIKK